MFAPTLKNVSKICVNVYNEMDRLVSVCVNEGPAAPEESFS